MNSTYMFDFLNKQERKQPSCMFYHFKGISSVKINFFHFWQELRSQAKMTFTILLVGRL